MEDFWKRLQRKNERRFYTMAKLQKQSNSNHWFLRRRILVCSRYEEGQCLKEKSACRSGRKCSSMEDRSDCVAISLSFILLKKRKKDSKRSLWNRMVWPIFIFHLNNYNEQKSGKAVIRPMKARGHWDGSMTMKEWHTLGAVLELLRWS